MKNLVALVALFFVACSNSDNPTNNTNNNSTKFRNMPIGFTNDSIRFTSVMPNAAASDGEEKEWFTITNFGYQPIDLSNNWIVRDLEKQIGQQIYYKFDNVLKGRDSVKIFNKTTYAFMRNTDDTLYLYKLNGKDTTLVDMIFWKDAEDNQVFYR